MASYTELRNLFEDGSLMGKIEVAVIVEAELIRANGSATAQQKAWAVKAITETNSEAKKALKIALAQNKALSKAQIETATDAGLQSAVASVVNLLAGL